MTPTPFITITPDAGRIGPVWWVNSIPHPHLSKVPAFFGHFCIDHPRSDSLLPLYAADIIRRYHRHNALNELASLTEYDE